MIKRILIILSFFFLSLSPVHAEEATVYLTITHSVKEPVNTPLLKEIYSLSTPSATPISWMISQKALADSSLVQTISQFKNTSPYQEIGADLEDPTDRLIDYPPKERASKIDQYMDKFYQSFGTYPHSVSICHPDSISMEYLQKKYALITFLSCDEQYASDTDKLWGGYIGSPYLPNKKNPLIPADTSKNSLPVVVAKLANRDLFHFYGGGTERFYNSNPNDFLQKNLSIFFLNSLIDQYYQNNLNPIAHLNIELERLFLPQEFEILNSWKQKSRIKIVTLNQFGERFLERFINGSPSYFYKITDPLKKENTIFYWYQSPKFRVGIKAEENKTTLIDLRSYNQNFADDYNFVKNDSTYLNAILPYQVDSVQLPTSKKVLTEDLYHQEASLDQIKEIGLSALIPNQKSSSLFYEILIILLILYLFRRENKWGLFFGFISLLTLWFSGQIRGFGMGFFGPNGHDALFHLSLIRHFAENPFSLNHPQLAGQLISNYHFGLDYFLGISSRLSSLSPISLYFRIFPFLLICLLVSGITRLLRSLSFTATQIKLALFMTFFASSLGWLVSLIMNKQLSGESVFWANQAISYPLNPPLSTSLVLMVWFYYFYLTKKNTLILVALGSLLAPTKVYAFILLVLALLIQRKFKLFFAIAVLGALLLLPTLDLGRSILEFNPFWFIKSLFESPDHLYLPKLAQAIQTYQNSGKLLQLTIINLFGLGIFIVGNFSIRLLAVFQNITKENKLGFLISFLGLLFPLFFIQVSNPWNTIQFVYYSQFFFGLLSAKVLKGKLIYLAILLSIIGSYATLQDYLSFLPSSRVAPLELEAINKLTKFEKGQIVSPAHDSSLSKDISSPKPLYAYVSTAYLSALTGFPEYLSDTINLDITLKPYQDRLKNVKKLYQTTDITWAKDFLNANGIKYLYETPLSKIKIEHQKICLDPIIAEGEIKIYKFDCHAKIKD